jgi:uncharacterized lipoprotein
MHVSAANIPGEAMTTAKLLLALLIVAILAGCASKPGAVDPGYDGYGRARDTSD